MRARAKSARVERPEVVDALADTDELHGKAELDGDRDRDTASRAPVQLRERDTRYADGVAEETRLLQAVLAGGRIDDEERLVRRAVETPGDDRDAPSRARP